MFSTGAVVSGSGVALKCIAEVTAVQVVVPQVIMASPEERGEKEDEEEEDSLHLIHYTSPTRP